MKNQFFRSVTSRVGLSQFLPSRDHAQIKTVDEDKPACVGDRELFYWLMHPESNRHVMQLAKSRMSKQLAEIDRKHKPDEMFSGNPDQIKAEIEGLQRQSRIDAVTDSRGMRGVIRQYAPSALVELCWLQSISNAAQAHTEISALMFRLYSSFFGFAENRRSHVCVFRQVLADFNIALPDAQTWLFASNPGFIEASLTAPLTSLCLAQLPVTYLPEILGYTLAHCFDLSALQQLIRKKAEMSSNRPDSLEHYLDQEQMEDSRELVIQAVHAYVKRQSSQSQAHLWSRLARGVLLYINAEDELLESVLKQSVQVQAIWQDFVGDDRHTVSDTNIAGCLTLCGAQLDDWFINEPLVAMNIVREVANSDNPDYQNAQMRRFFSDLSVFDENSLTDSDYRKLKLLAKRFTCIQAPELRKEQSQFLSGNLVQSKRSFTPAGLDKHNKYTARQLYYELLNLENNPQCLAASHHFVAKQLSNSTAVLRRIRPAYLRLIEYSQAAFDQQIQAIFQTEADQYQAFVAPPKLSKEAYVWGIKQFAPLLLVDGSWLQNSFNAGNHQHAVSSYLIRIYADEIGNGRCDWNHANVYRHLLESIRIELPEFTSKAFAEHREFVDSAFDLPVFFLAISQFSSTYSAEIIGLNLAIELSGLGSIYRRLVDELDFWEIDSTIVSLHLSIDNLATGHAALAQDAVTAYLDQIRNQYGYAEMQRHWQRIWSGYLSLQIVPGDFKRALIWNYCKQFVFRFQTNRN